MMTLYELMKLVKKPILGFKKLTPGHDNTNLVLEIKTKEESVILKIRKQVEGDIGSFWKGLEGLFGYQLNTDFDQQKALSEILKKEGVIDIPQVYKTCKTHNGTGNNFILMQKMKGLGISKGSKEEVDFRSNPEILFALGQQIGKLHFIRRRIFGSISGEKSWGLEEFPKRLAENIAILSKSPEALKNSDVQNLVPKYIEMALSMPTPEAASLIMLDLWPSQFLIKNGKISALVDIESYVWGPPELELAVLELWVEDFNSFRKGYESVGNVLPDLEPVRELYRFYLYLANSCPELGIERLQEWCQKTVQQSHEVDASQETKLSDENSKSFEVSTRLKSSP